MPIGGGLQAFHLVPGRVQLVDGPEGIVDPRVQVETDRGFRHGNDARRGCQGDVLDFLKGPVESGQNAVELDCHRERHRPTRGVIGLAGGRAGIGNVVRMVLGLKHVEQVRPECLGGFDDVGAFGVLLVGHREIRGGPMHADAGAHEGVDELGGGQEVGLIRRHNEAARVAIGRLVEQLVKLPGLRPRLS